MLLRILLTVIALVGVARACSVPVFRYALEHWEADPFEAVVFHRGGLSAADQGEVSALAKAGANLTVRVVNLDQKPEVDLGGQSLPWLTLSAPHGGAKLWSGPLTQGRAVLDSPARKEIAKRLSDGQSAVWVLLESGERAKDEEAAATLSTRLDYLGSTLTLPKLEEQDIANGLVSVAQEDLRLEFSTLRIARKDPAEQFFVQMLLATEPDLATASEPMVFPIFGRGRALYALVGAGIRPETIDRAAIFLIGKCSCELKEKSPGTDLLLAADWNGAIKAKSAPLPDLPRLAELRTAAPQMVTIKGSPAPVAEASRQVAIRMWTIGAVAVLLLGGGAFGLAIRRR